MKIFSGCTISNKDGTEEAYDGCIIAAHAPDALQMLGKQATYDESRILGAFQYAYRFTPSLQYPPKIDLTQLYLLISLWQ